MDLPRILGNLEAVAKPGGIIHGINPDLIKVLASLMHAMMEETAVLPVAYTPGNTATGASSSSNSQVETKSVIPPAVAVKRASDRSENETGTGEAHPKQPKDDLNDDSDAEFSNLG